MTTADLHTLTGAYALHALSDRESEEFARHLAACAACTQEVRELQATAARLGLAAAETPSAEFRARVFAALPEVRQLPPLVPGTGGSAGGPLARLHWLHWQRRLPQFAVAASLLLALVAGGVAWNARQEVQDQRARVAVAQQQEAQLNALLAAPDATFRVAPVKGGGSSTVVNSVSLQRTALVYQGLAPLPGSQVYQLWYSIGGQMVPAGFVPATADGVTMLTGTSNGAAGVGVTVEPKGGSAKPTSTPVLLVPLPTA